MFENLFATYNQVEAPKLDPNIYQTEEIVQELPFVQEKVTYQPTTQPTQQEVVEIQDTPQKKPATQKKIQQIVGTAAFENAFKQAVKENPSIAKYKNFLTKTAKMESNFNSRIQNRQGAPYYGYFQFGEAALKSTSNLTMEQFRNNPVEQIKAAAKLYEQFLSQAKKVGVYNKAKSLGYSDDAIVAGAWLGGVGGVSTFLNKGIDRSDKHWSKSGKVGTTVGTRMKQFNE